MGATPTMLGINASMPAIGWLIALPFLPKLQARFGLGAILLACLTSAFIGLIGFVFIEDQYMWLFFRLLYGGGMGFFYRCIEFWVNDISENENRGKQFGTYSFLWVLGIIIGSYLPSILPDREIIIQGLIFVTLICSFIVVHRNRLSFKKLGVANVVGSFSILSIVPIALLSVAIYSISEDLSAYLMSVYVLKMGHSEDIAVLTLTVVALGMLAFSIPIGYISDRIDRSLLIILFYICLSVLTICIILYSSTQNVFLILLFLWGGFLSSIYNISMSIIGDRFKDRELAVANSTYGIVYAIGSVVGPIAAGISMDVWQPHGALYLVLASFVVGIFASVWFMKRGVNA